MQNISRIFYHTPYLLPILFAYLIGFDRPVHFVAEIDLSLISEALKYNSNFKQLSPNNPSLTTSILLAYWFKLVNFLGLIQIDNMSKLFATDDKVNTLKDLIFYLRIFSLLVIEVYLLTFHNFLKVLRLNKLTTFSCMILLAGSEGILSQSIMGRMEPLSCIFLILSITSIYASSYSQAYSFSSIFKTAMQVCFFAYIAAITKTSSLIYFLLILPVALAFIKRMPKERGTKTDYFRFAKYVLVILPLLIFLKLEDRVFDGQITTSQWFFITELSIVFSVMFFKYFKSSLVAATILGGTIGIYAGYQINLLKFDPINHEMILNFFEHSVIFSTNLLNNNDSSINNVSIFFWNFLSSIKSKFYLIWLGEYPIQIIFLFSLFFFFKLSKKKAWNTVLQISAYLMVFLVAESINKLLMVLPYGALLSTSNFSSIAYNKIYIEFFLLTSFALGHDAFLKIHKISKIFLIVLTIVILSISIASFSSTYVKVKNNGLSSTPTKQNPQSACKYIKTFEPEISAILGHFSNSCKEGIEKLTNSNQNP